MEPFIEPDVIHSILDMYGIAGGAVAQHFYIHYAGEDRVKLIFRVTLENGHMLVLKLLREQDDLPAARRKIESQSAFSEFMRGQGIRTPLRYRAGGAYCREFIWQGMLCNVTVEDWCGEEILTIDAELARRIGALMAQMHALSLAHRCEIGCGTLFCAASQNDVEAYAEFSRLCRHERLDQNTVAAIGRLREEKLACIRALWPSLPRAAVQGDISVNNLVYGEDALTVFDYNNAGDEALVSDLVLEGLLTAYEMDLPDGQAESIREEFFPAFLRGYLSVRPLNDAERAAAREIYALYHALWFTRILYHADSLEQLLARGDFEAANRLLHKILQDLSKPDDGRFDRPS